MIGYKWGKGRPAAPNWFNVRLFVMSQSSRWPCCVVWTREIKITARKLDCVRAWFKIRTFVFGFIELGAILSVCCSLSHQQQEGFFWVCGWIQMDWPVDGCAGCCNLPPHPLCGHWSCLLAPGCEQRRGTPWRLCCCVSVQQMMTNREQEHGSEGPGW